MLQSLSRTLDFQAQALSLRAERQQLLASNIANADTPGYQARDMDFAAALRQATSSAGAPPPVTVTSRGHISGTSGGSTVSTTALRYATPSQDNLDGNTVDMDRERASFVDNALKYEASLRFINANVRSMLDAMRSPAQG